LSKQKLVPSKSHFKWI